MSCAAVNNTTRSLPEGKGKAAWGLVSDFALPEPYEIGCQVEVCVLPSCPPALLPTCPPAFLPCRFLREAHQTALYFAKVLYDDGVWYAGVLEKGPRLRNGSHQFMISFDDGEDIW